MPRSRHEPRPHGLLGIVVHPRGAWRGRGGHTGRASAATATPAAGVPVTVSVHSLHVSTRGSRVREELKTQATAPRRVQNWGSGWDQQVPRAKDGVPLSSHPVRPLPTWNMVGTGWRFSSQVVTRRQRLRNKITMPSPPGPSAPAHSTQHVPTAHPAQPEPWGARKGGGPVCRSTEFRALIGHAHAPRPWARTLLAWL